MVQNITTRQQNVNTERPEQQHDMHAPETSFLNWKKEEFCALNDDAPVSANTRAKKRALEMEKISSKDKVTNAAEPPFSTNAKVATPAFATKDTIHKQAEPVATKIHQKSHAAVPFNIVDNMKKMNITMSMWDTLAIPGQTDLLRRALSDEVIPKMTGNKPYEAVLTNADHNDEKRDGAKEVNSKSSKSIKPPPFYLSLIIGNKLVHNCLVDSGATSSVMPKRVADQLGLNYQPLEKGGLQLDVTTINTVDFIKDANLTLHACTNYPIYLDIYVIDLPPYFAMCLSRDFTTKIGGYLSSDWSYMLFRTRYGTKVIIKSESLAKDHIEPYVPCAINANLVSFEKEDHAGDFEDKARLDDIPDILLDEWAENHTSEDHHLDFYHTGLGNYVIQEQDAVIPNLVKSENLVEKEPNQLWELYFDGSKSRNGAGGGAMLVSPHDEKYFSAFRFSFACSNNVAEYEGLVQGLEWDRKRGIECIKVYGDNKLIVKQVRGLNATKNDTLKLYKHRVWDIIEDFSAFNIVSIPRNQNQHTGRLAAIGAQCDILAKISKENIQ